MDGSPTLTGNAAGALPAGDSNGRNRDRLIAAALCVVTFIAHILSALLFFCVLRRLSIPGAWIATMLFALHSVHVESVTCFRAVTRLRPDSGDAHSNLAEALRAIGPNDEAGAEYQRASRLGATPASR